MVYSIEGKLRGVRDILEEVKEIGRKGRKKLWWVKVVDGRLEWCLVGLKRTVSA